MNAKKISTAFFVLSALLVASFSYLAMADESNNGKNIFIDSDQDGLSDEEEKIYHTDPYKADTDGDGYSDGAEVASGYDPLKPAPGDKIIQNTGTSNSQSETKESSDNLTQQLTKKVTSVLNQSSGEDKDITMDEVQSIVDDTLSSKTAVTDSDLPDITEKDIKIKKQNYQNLSKEKRQEKMKDDFMSYTTSIAYIFSSNSPKAITSADDITSVAQGYSNQIVSALTTRNADSLNDLAQSGQKIFDQMKSVEVPEDAVEMHIQGLKLAQYAINLKSAINANSEDPLSDMVGMSKIQSFMEIAMSYSEEINSKFSEYGISYTDTLSQLKDISGSESSK